MEYEYLKAFACYNNDDDLRRQGSSGGVYSLIAKSVLKSNGVIYAVVYDNQFNVKYKRIISETDLEASYGSKYVEANLGESFKAIREDLNTGIDVLFVGTPCHCVGLKAFLGKEYNNLLCVDFICHGVPSKKVWRNYIDAVKKHEPHVVKVNMRSKHLSWLKFGFEKEYDNQSSVFENRMENVYLRGFLRDLYLRPSCHGCKFKGLKRQTDITIGDFWGAPFLFSEDQYEGGMSAVIIHNSKGQECFEAIKNNLKTFDVSTENLILKNSALMSQSKFNPNRNEFFKRFNKGENLKRIVYDLTGKKFISKIRNRIKSIILSKTGASNAKR